jgi:hypothetical protein
MKRSFAVSFTAALSALLIISFAGKQPAWTTALLLLDAVVLNVALKGMLVKTFFVGMIFGVIGEAVATHYHIWTYRSPQLLGMPLFIPLMWGICAILFAELASNLKEI